MFLNNAIEQYLNTLSTRKLLKLKELVDYSPTGVYWVEDCRQFISPTDIENFIKRKGFKI